MVEDRPFDNLDVPPAPYDTETEFVRCTFRQDQPNATNTGGRRLWPGDDTPRTFTDCNLVNCELPPGSTVTRCNTALIESLLEPVLIEYGPGQTVEMLYTRRRHHGRVNPTTLQVELVSPPNDLGVVLEEQPDDDVLEAIG